MKKFFKRLRIFFGLKKIEIKRIFKNLIIEININDIISSILGLVAIIIGVLVFFTITAGFGWVICWLLPPIAKKPTLEMYGLIGLIPFFSIGIFAILFCFIKKFVLWLRNNWIEAGRILDRE